MIQLELVTSSGTTELVDLQKSMEATEQKIVDPKTAMGKERDEVRVDWSVMLAQVKDGKQEASTYISEPR